jgi:predicted Zn-dependent protease
MRIVAFLLDIGDVRFAAEIAAALGLGVEFGLVLPYSRRQEIEADEIGLRIMAAAEYPPDEAVALWQRMDAAMGARSPGFLATHPAPESRIEAIEAILREL